MKAQTIEQMNEIRVKKLILWHLTRKELLEFIGYPNKARLNNERKAIIVQYLIETMSIEDVCESVTLKHGKVYPKRNQE